MRILTLTHVQPPLEVDGADFAVWQDMMRR